MFSFFKKKMTEEEKPKVSISDAKEMREKAKRLADSLSSADDDQAKVKLLNEIGECYAKAGDTDEAINYYEQSLSVSRQMGKAYTDLLKLYNVKRQEAAVAGDDDKMKEYMDKVQGLMQSSKDMLRGKA